MKLCSLLISILALMCCIGCTDDEGAPAYVQCCVQWAWHNGRSVSRALTLLMDEGGSDLDVAAADYPTTIEVQCRNKSFTLTKPDILEACTQHDGFFHGYTSDYPLKDIEARKGVTATATTDGGDVLYANTEDVVLDERHLLLTLHHRKALVRFTLKLDEDYDKLRYVHVKNIELQKTTPGTAVPCILRDGGLVLATNRYHCVGYVYVDPTEFTRGMELTLSCTYDIYDKDATLARGASPNEAELEAAMPHRTRRDVRATNGLTFNMLLEGTPVATLQPGYYYDLNIKLNPDYLYVLAEHDNKHITIQ